MARPLRIEYEGAIYHVTARGNERAKIFFSKKDYEQFKEYIAAAINKFNLILHAYVLMTNHYHLIVETPEKNLSKIMHFVNGSYTTYLNIKRKRTGHLFQGRYKAILVDKESYLFQGLTPLSSIRRVFTRILSVLDPHRVRMFGMPNQINQIYLIY
jgi:putative transposase